MLNDHENNIVATQQELVNETLEDELQRRCTVIDEVGHLPALYMVQINQSINLEPSPFPRY
jgi:hypothetical protein